MGTDAIRRTYIPQGGLEVPCVLTFVAAEEKEKVKTKRILNQCWV